MTLQDLALLVDSDVGNLSRIERGVQIPSRELAEKICKQFPGEVTEIQLIYPERFASDDSSEEGDDGTSIPNRRVGDKEAHGE